MNAKLIKYDTPEYDEMLDLRYRLLRQPLGLAFSDADLIKDRLSKLIGCYDDNDKLIGCCILSQMGSNTVKLRQMAIDSDSQRQGIGAKLLAFAEDKAREFGYSFVYLHARKVAVDFYKKYGYNIESEEFIEVGIPHYEMIKNIEETK